MTVAPVATSDHPGADAGAPVGQLRGAAVEVDGRKVARVLVGAVMITLAALAIGFTVAGVHDNAQITQLRTQGVRVTVTVTSCRGSLGGSGSNVAGYTCSGSYALGGQRYSGPLPGDSFYTPGSKVPALAVPGDPSLVSPLYVIDGEHASAGVFAWPAVLFAASVLLGGVVLLRVRRRRRTAHGAGPTG